MIHKTIREIILDSDVSIGIILGGRRKGKSVLGYGIIDALHTEYPAFVFGLPESKHRLLPPHIKPIQDLDEIPDQSVFVVDEAYKEFYARMSMSAQNKFIDTLVALSGQKRLKAIYITQQARRLELGIVGGVDFILFKKPSLMQMQFDRSQLRQRLAKVYKAFQNLKPPEGITLKDYQKQCTYVFSEDFVGMMENSNTPPTWWSEEISRAYAGVSLIDKKKTERQMLRMFNKYIGGERAYTSKGKYIPKSKREKNEQT